MKAVRAKRVVIVGHAGERGGSQTAFRRLAEFAHAEGHDVRLVLISKRPSRGHFIKVLGELPQEPRTFLERVRKAAWIAAIGARIRAFSPDLYVTVGLNTTSRVLARFAGGSCWKVAQDFIADRRPDDPVWHRTAAFFDEVAVQSPSMLKTSPQPRPGERARRGWLPCFAEEPHAGVRRVGGPVEGRPVRLAYFGRLAQNKGLPLLLAAFRRCEFCEAAALDIWGVGPEEKTVRSKIEELGLHRWVTLHGPYPSGMDGARLMASYDALVLTSTGCEGLPLILLEALSYGLPILATDVGAIRDCCDGNPGAVLVEPEEGALVLGLRSLVQTIRSGGFPPDEIVGFYDSNFAKPVMEARWRKVFETPQPCLNNTQ